MVSSISKTFASTPCDPAPITLPRLAPLSTLPMTTHPDLKPGGHNTSFKYCCSIIQHAAHNKKSLILCLKMWLSRPKHRECKEVSLDFVKVQCQSRGKMSTTLIFPRTVQSSLASSYRTLNSPSWCCTTSRFQCAIHRRRHVS